MSTYACTCSIVACSMYVCMSSVKYTCTCTCHLYRLPASQLAKHSSQNFKIHDTSLTKRLRQRKSIHCSRNTFLISRDTLVHYFIMTSPIPINNTYQRSSNKDHEMFVTPPASPNKQVNLDSVFVWCGVLLKMGGHPRWDFHPFAIVVVFSHFLSTHVYFLNSYIN